MQNGVEKNNSIHVTMYEVIDFTDGAKYNDIVEEINEFMKWSIRNDKKYYF